MTRTPFAVVRKGVLLAPARILEVVYMVRHHTPTSKFVGKAVHVVESDESYTISAYSDHHRAGTHLCFCLSKARETDAHNPSRLSVYVVTRWEFTTHECSLYEPSEDSW